MTRRRKVWPPVYTDTDRYTHTASVADVRLRRYDGTWCAETRSPGQWRDAFWLGRITRRQVVDALARPVEQPIAGQGQLEMHL